ncbi:unnamed protein product [Merluccius merluccius]
MYQVMYQVIYQVMYQVMYHVIYQVMYQVMYQVHITTGMEEERGHREPYQISCEAGGRPYILLTSPSMSAYLIPHCTPQRNHRPTNPTARVYGPYIL